MSSRSDKWFARMYEADVIWYKNFINKPTEAQMSLIRSIKETNTMPPFNGRTKKEASKYIAEYYKNYNGFGGLDL